MLPWSLSSSWFWSSVSWFVPYSLLRPLTQRRRRRRRRCSCSSGNQVARCRWRGVPGRRTSPIRQSSQCDCGIASFDRAVSRQLSAPAARPPGAAAAARRGNRWRHSLFCDASAAGNISQPRFLDVLRLVVVVAMATKYLIIHGYRRPCNSKCYSVTYRLSGCRFACMFRDYYTIQSWSWVGSNHGLGWVGWRLDCVIFLTSWNTLLSVNEYCSWIITFIDSWYAIPSVDDRLGWVGWRLLWVGLGFEKVTHDQLWYNRTEGLGECKPPQRLVLCSNGNKIYFAIPSSASWAGPPRKSNQLFCSSHIFHSSEIIHQNSFTTFFELSCSQTNRQRQKHNLLIGGEDVLSINERGDFWNYGIVGNLIITWDIDPSDTEKHIICYITYINFLERSRCFLETDRPTRQIRGYYVSLTRSSKYPMDPVM